MPPVKATAVPLSIDYRTYNLHNYELWPFIKLPLCMYLGMLSAEFRFVSKVAET